ncbi:MAG: hypothetical protein HY588_00705 [Candidatus Omnitrophica bacterium]|nr:hypothetical protein [Candidatus Omnitrophota bacterium]
MRILFYLLVGVAAVVLLRQIFPPREKKAETPNHRFRLKAKKSPREMWVQVYDTDSLAEAQGIQAHLEEEELECFVYEQGRKDIHGNLLKGYGIIVPRTSVPLAQKVVSRSIV